MEGKFCSGELPRFEDALIVDAHLAILARDREKPCQLLDKLDRIFETLRSWHPNIHRANPNASTYDEATLIHWDDDVINRAARQNRGNILISEHFLWRCHVYS